ncbi:ferritin-like domain-containing protein [Christiangramia sp. SM2212]|uniref:Ferritin-like domain-containing protein n=1 Tax=Christiangramia sediminicola TaxID=3073267 RepID=A0ABU1ER62_9FLAO|nr:ferritin-like domain-containing protein [Christiangramia sp. SM2212]MDR5590698.1 ferritin-like domain-containing protein [Christiangramia sp. SM2212]
MNFIKFLDKVADGDLLDAKSSRRESFGHMKNIGKNAAMASIPFAFAATSNKTKAATMATSYASAMASPTEILNFALTLEYLEKEFYQIGMDTDGLITGNARDVFGLILKHEDEHVKFLLAALGDNAIEKPNFDFTAGGSFDTFSNYQTFLLLSQGFEDTGVRAYKGQAGALIDNNALLEYALQIHSIEARHASKVRRMRMEKGWITGAGDQSSPIAAVYAGEDNKIQGGVDLSLALSKYSSASLTEAFDEPLTMQEVNAIASLFIQ